MLNLSLRMVCKCKYREGEGEGSKGRREGRVERDKTLFL